MISAADPVPLRITAGTSWWIFLYKSSIVPGVPRTNVHTIGKPSSLHGLLFLVNAGIESKRNQ